MIAQLILLATLRQGPLDAKAIYKRALPSVMTLSSVTKAGDRVLGTAFLAIKDGVAVTAWHVIKDAAKVSARFADGQEFDVSGLIDKDEKRDVAIIRVKVADRPLLDFQSVDPEAGAKCFLIGAPQGLEFSISDGIISQVRTLDGIKQLQFTCPQNPGNSGGPLLDEAGKVYGVADWHWRNAEGLNFAIAGTYAKALDASLPTTEWAQVSSTPEQPTATDSGTAQNFHIDFPGKPSKTHSETKTRGGTVHTTTYTSQGGGVVVLVSCSDFPDDLSAKDEKEFVKSYIDAFIRSSHATETSRQRLSINGYNGQEAEFTLRSQSGSVWVFVANGFGFGIAVMASKDLESARDRVFNSFHTT